VVNQPCSFTPGSSLTNGFAPTTTLGCGSWGRNSISENLDLQTPHERVAYRQSVARKKVPTDAGIWGLSSLSKQGRS